MWRRVLWWKFDKLGCICFLHLQLHFQQKFFLTQKNINNEGSFYPFSVHIVTFNLIPTLCTYLIKNYHNSHLKPHTLKMSVMHN